MENDHTRELFERVNLLRYFTLPAWGVELQRAWELVNTIDADNRCLITRLDGHPMQLMITPAIISQALHLGQSEIHMGSQLTNEERRQILAQDSPSFDQLRHQGIRLAV